jgi:hypothetical protein
MAYRLRPSERRDGVVRYRVKPATWVAANR